MLGQQAWRVCRAIAACVLLLLPRPGALAPAAASSDVRVAQLLQALQGAGVQGVAQQYDALMSHQHSLSRGHLQRSLVFRGANLGMRRVLHKLISSAPQRISIGVIGGSISWGHGVLRGTEDWFSLLSDWLRRTFPQHAFTFKNGCVPATRSSYVSSCLQQFVDPDADLVFVEYCTNDGYHHGDVDNSLVRSFERLLRKLLFGNHPGAPAVVLMEFLATDVLANQLPFYATGEDQYGVLAQYYGLPWLSYRDTIWHEYLANAPGFQRLEVFPADEERHPTPLGHKYLADMAINLIQQTYLDSLLHPLAPRELTTGPLAQVPPPMFEGNWQSSNLVCVVGEQLPASVVHNSGFDWVNEGSSEKPKWGFVSWSVGATLRLRVDTRASVGPPPSQRQHVGAAAAAARPGQQPADAAGAAAAAAAGGGGMIVWVGYVKSWRHMGSASLSCVSGCKCQGTAVDAMHEVGNTQSHLAKLYTTQAAECIIEVKVNEWARSKEHKFKVTALMVTHAVEFSGHGDFTDTVLLSTIEGAGPSGARAPDDRQAGAAAGAAAAAAAG